MLDQPEHERSEEEKGVPQPRRWRILMYYMCNSVLGFEISKRRGDESPGLGDLVV
jgi:hypothetical protein